MRYVTVPDPILLYRLDTGQPMPREIKPDGTAVPDEPWTLYRFVSRFLISDAKIGPGKKGAKTAKRLRRAFEHAVPGQCVAIDSADYDACVAVMNAPTDAWNQTIASQLEPFMSALEDAPEEVPMAVNGRPSISAATDLAPASS